MKSLTKVPSELSPDARRLYGLIARGGGSIDPTQIAEQPSSPRPYEGLLREGLYEEIVAAGLGWITRATWADNRILCVGVETVSEKLYCGGTGRDWLDVEVWLDSGHRYALGGREVRIAEFSGADWSPYSDWNRTGLPAWRLRVVHPKATDDDGDHVYVARFMVVNPLPTYTGDREFAYRGMLVEAYGYGWSDIPAADAVELPYTPPWRRALRDMLPALVTVKMRPKKGWRRG